MNTLKVNYIFTALGIILLGAGLYLLKTLTAPQGFMLAFPYVCIGLGCGISGHGVGNILSFKALKKNPDMQHLIEIDRKDERNLAIANRAKAKAYDMMTFIFGALMISFALMGVGMAATLLFVFAYLFVHGCGIYYHFKYSKDM